MAGVSRRPLVEKTWPFLDRYKPGVFFGGGAVGVVLCECLSLANALRLFTVF